MSTLSTSNVNSATAPLNAFRRNLNTISIVWYRDLLRYVRDPIRIATSLMQPLMFLFIFGSGLRSSLSMTGEAALPPGASSFDFRTFLFPGILSMVVLYTAIFSAVSIVWDREFGFLREVLVAPIARTSVVLGKASGGSTVAMLQGTVMLIFAPLIGVSLTPVLVIKLMLEMLLLAFCLTCMGIVVASRMKSLEGFQVITQLLLLPMFFLSGALFPLKKLPTWLAILNRLDPVTYGVDPLRQAVLSTLNLPDSVKSALGLGITIFNYTLSVPMELGIVAVLGLIFVVWAAASFSKQD